MEHINALYGAKALRWRFLYPILVVLFLMPLASFSGFAYVDDGSPSSCPCGMRTTMSHGPVLIDAGGGNNQGCGENMLWIEGPPGCENRFDLSMPEGSLAVELISPGTSGYMMLFRRLPTGDLQLRYMGYVYSGHRYRLNFCADYPGSSEVWYKVGFKESDHIRFHVS